MHTKAHHNTRETRAGFTLIEVLVVIAIILLLVGITIPAVNTAKKNAKKKIVYTEIKTLETAWREYLRTYRKPPDNRAMGIMNPLETHKVRINANVASMLEGNDVGGQNSKKIRFMEFKRRNSDGEPITPWGSLDAAQSTDRDYYYVKFDRNFNKSIDAGGGEPDDPPTDIVHRDVIVWSYNMTVPEGDDLFVLGSWKN